MCNRTTKFALTSLLIASLLPAVKSAAQPFGGDPFANRYNEHNGSFYIGAGYNTGWTDASAIRINQGGLGNKYEMISVDGDKKNEGAKPLNIAYQVGYFFNRKQDMAIELSYTPVTYHIKDGQRIVEQGTKGNMPYNDGTLFAAELSDYYYLKGGNILVNYVKKFGIYRSKRNNISIDFLAKGGVGPTISQRFHTDFEGNESDKNSMQINGWDAGLTAAFRGTFFRHFYVELAPQMNFAFYSNMPIAQGTARQNLTTNSLTASVGFTLPTNKHNPLFKRIPKEQPPKVIEDVSKLW